MTSPTVFVTGSTGFVGRWLVLDLLRQSQHVIVLLRSPAGLDEMKEWVAAKGVDAARLTAVRGDLTAPDLGLDVASLKRLQSTRDVFHVAGRYAFGLSRQQAYDANVLGTLALAHLASRWPDLRCFVHVSGYRVAEKLPSGRPTRGTLDGLYAKLGSYEASKVEADAAVRTFAREVALPLAVVAPGVVVGDAATGETNQMFGVVDVFRDLADGTLRALPGGRNTFVPLVAVDYLAHFLAAVPNLSAPHPSTYTMLDSATPPFHELIRHAASRLGVHAPKVALPVSLLRRLPQRLTGAEPEALSFLSTDRYDTHATDQALRQLNIAAPPILEAFDHWLDYLVAANFGRQTTSRAGGAAGIAHQRTFGGT